MPQHHTKSRIAGHLADKSSTEKTMDRYYKNASKYIILFLTYVFIQKIFSPFLIFFFLVLLTIGLLDFLRRIFPWGEQVLSI